MRPSYMLLLLVLVSIGLGVTIGRGSYFGAVAFGVVALIAFVDFYLNFRRDQSAARRWHAYRRDLLEKLIAEHKDRAWQHYQAKVGQDPNAQQLDARRLEEDAARQAEQELMEKLGPPY